jgi:hypothetical protein
VPSQCQVHDALEDAEQLLEQAVVVGRRVVGADGLEVPERRVDGVVLGRLAGVGEAIGQHAAIDEAREGRQDRG